MLRVSVVRCRDDDQLYRRHAGLASLSFLGLGTQPPSPEWGIMIDEARGQFQTHPWPMTVPGAAIALTVLTASVLGNALRDLLDPRLPA